MDSLLYETADWVERQKESSLSGNWLSDSGQAMPTLSVSISSQAPKVVVEI